MFILTKLGSLLGILKNHSWNTLRFKVIKVLFFFCDNKHSLEKYANCSYWFNFYLNIYTAFCNKIIIEKLVCVNQCMVWLRSRNHILVYLSDWNFV